VVSFTSAHSPETFETKLSRQSLKKDVFLRNIVAYRSVARQWPSSDNMRTTTDTNATMAHLQRNGSVEIV
jgi:hypothetical protein